MEIRLLNENWKKADGTPDDAIVTLIDNPVVDDFISIDGTGPTGPNGKVGMWQITQIVRVLDSNNNQIGRGYRVTFCPKPA